MNQALLYRRAREQGANPFVYWLVRAIFQPLINRSVGWLDWYERRMCRWLPISDMRYVLRTKKEPALPMARAG